VRVPASTYLPQTAAHISAGPAGERPDRRSASAAGRRLLCARRRPAAPSRSVGDISAHFNPATTLAFALRRDMGWIMAGAYWVVQFAAAACGSLLARAFFGSAGNLAATMPKPGQSWQAAGFEAILTFGLVLMVLNLANGPKLNGPFVPLAVGAYILAWGTMGGPYDGASMNPARSFGPDLAIGNLSTWWVYLIGPVAGAVLAVGVAYVLRGPAKVQEAAAAVGTPLDRGT
jgi:glycerol uptake facilitator-like aquaporin